MTKTTESVDDLTRQAAGRIRRTREENAKLAHDMGQLYDKGASIRTIAEYYGVAYGTAHRLLKYVAQVPLRSRGGNRPKVYLEGVNA